MRSNYQRHPADNTPIIIGAGQTVERLQNNSAPPFTSPMQLAGNASARALEDAGIEATQIDTIAIIRLFSDAAKAWHSPFGGSNNPPESVAQRIGATPDYRIYSNVGGTEPLQLMMELCRAIACGEKKVALLAGAEAIANQRYAIRNGHKEDWKEEYHVPLDNREYRKRYASREELSSGLSLPVHYYALIESIQAHQMGHDVQQHRKYMARLMAPFSQIASNNPYAQSRAHYTANELATPTATNYLISAPYSKLFVAQDAVNQASALLLTSVGHARQLGVDPRQWVFLESYAEGTEDYLSQREDPGRSAVMDQVLNTVMDKSGATPEDMDLIDIYSCFPCAVSAACDALSLPTDGSLPLTVTGGLPYFGGPGNNYTTHALAEVALRLRGDPSRALVTANGGFLSKHAAAILTTDTARAALSDWGTEDTNTIFGNSAPPKPYADRPQGGTIISYTVRYKREKKDIGIVLAETASGERFLASSTEPAITQRMHDCSPIGRNISVEIIESRQVFRFFDS